MNIAIFTDSYLPYRSGVVKSITTFSHELKKLGHRVYIFAPAYDKCENEVDVYRFRSLRAPTFKEFALAIPVSPSLSDKIQQLKIDIIHVHSPFLMGQLGKRIAHKLKLPLVLTYHTLYEEYVHYFPLAPTLIRKAARNYTISFCNKCNLVISPTKVIASYLEKNGVKVPVACLPTGIEIERFSNLDSSWLRNRLNLSKDKTILLHVGRLGKEKNINFILNAFAIIHNKYPSTHLVFVGSGPLKRELENQAKNFEIAHAVTFAGTFSFKEMPNIYAGADIFIFASLTETQGLVIGEAKAAGLPVVAVKAYGINEMVSNRHDGFLTSLDITSYTNCISKLVENPTLRQQMSQWALINAKSLSSTTMARRLETLYQDLLR